MTTVIPSGDCGNSPKNTFLENLTIAYAKGEIPFILDSVSVDILWDILGQRSIQGKEDLAQALERMKDDKVAEIAIRHVVTHGKAGAVNGTMRMEDGRLLAFCAVYDFGNAKGTSVRGSTWYMIEMS